MISKRMLVALCIFSLSIAIPITVGAEPKHPTSMVSIGEGDDLLDPEVELKIGDTAPGFSLPNLATDKMQSLQEFIGKPIILFFIQSACYSCLQEAKALKILQEKHKGEFEVIAVGVDLLGKPMLVSWAHHNEIKYPVLLDPIFSVPEKYGFTFTPSSVIIDRKGKVAMIHAGYRPTDIETFEKELVRLIAE